MRNLVPVLVLGISSASGGAAALAAPLRLAPCSPAPPRLAIPDPPPGLQRPDGAGGAPLCRALAGMERRMVCLTTESHVDGSVVWHLGYWIDGRRRAAWNETPSAPNQAPAFTLESAELDGNRSPELIVAVNGSVHVLGENGEHSGPLPAPAWGRDSQAVRVGEERRCVLRLSNGSDARWYRLSRGKLVPVAPPQ